MLAAGRRSRQGLKYTESCPRPWTGIGRHNRIDEGQAFQLRSAHDFVENESSDQAGDQGSLRAARKVKPSIHLRLLEAK